jgi:hypothetical protein
LALSTVKRITSGSPALPSVTLRRVKPSCTQYGPGRRLRRQQAGGDGRGVGLFAHQGKGAVAEEDGKAGAAGRLQGIAPADLGLHGRSFRFVVCTDRRTTSWEMAVKLL